METTKMEGMMELSPEMMKNISGGVIVKAQNKYVVCTNDTDLYYSTFFNDLESAEAFARSRGYSTTLYSKEEFLGKYGTHDELNF